MAMKDNPTPKQVQKLHSRVQKLVDRTYGKDEEGRRNAKFMIHDTRDGHLPYQVVVPHIPFATNIEQGEEWDILERAFHAACINVISAAEALRSVEGTLSMRIRSFDNDRQMRKLAHKLLPTIIVAEAYSAFSDAPQWSKWVSTKEGEHKLPNYYKHWEFRADTFKKWLLEEKKKIIKDNGRPRRWLLKLSSSGACLNGLVVVPEDERPKHVALNRARREFLEKHEKQINTDAQAIEALIRSKKR
jgi:hypothetical protein